MQVVTKNVPQTSQNIGETVHNTVSHAHKKSHAIAQKIADRHDVHEFNQNLGSRVTDTRSLGEDHGWHDGRDESQSVENEVK